MPVRVTRSIMVQRDVAAVFRLWADFENFPRFMQHIHAVRKTGPDTSHWEMRAPLGKVLRWHARTTELEENRVIAWESTGGDVQNRGRVEFRPAGQGATDVTMAFEFTPPGGLLGEVLMRLFVSSEHEVEADLRNFKRYAESQPA